jgi:hypothetical protein
MQLQPPVAELQAPVAELQSEKPKNQGFSKTP